ncbi:PAS domain-containing protein [Undibacterium sp. Jales W-56]|uniref:ATP-binding protein n=1 Tax=Undibacterium sp. Jales W-56 TaxID=2897325 RepID=UPI0021D3BFCE|nr:ATP-binding protein [Undibacterium sp. Jales W-56]MCU6433522.1 PAS domain-containing protein [Undibacterium sp. Jales W-56]
MINPHSNKQSQTNDASPDSEGNLTVRSRPASLLLQEKPDELALNLMDLDLFQFLDSNPVPTFVINKEHVITHWNKATERLLGYSAGMMVSTQKQWQPFYRHKRPVLADVVIAEQVEKSINTFYDKKFKASTLIKGAYEVDDFFPHLGQSGLWLHFTAAPIYNNRAEVIGAIETLEDITERHDAEEALRKAYDDLDMLVKKRTVQLAEANRKLEADLEQRATIEFELIRRNGELTQLNIQLSKAQEQLLQSEKLASIGQLAAGVAHEINNPVGYIFSNFSSLEKYITDLFEILSAYESAEQHISTSAVRLELTEIKNRIELEFLKDDIPELMAQSKEGIARVRKIVQDLKDFSRTDTNHVWQWADLHRGIDSTLNIVNNEIKYKADVIKEYGNIPDVECLPTEINQVIMNLVVNASHAIGEERGKITVRTFREPEFEDEFVIIEVEDNGSGIPKEITSRIFDPFFTTKPIGKGTGLGLSLAYGVIQKHHGRISISSEVGKGSCFRIRLPIKHVEPINPDEESAS